MIVKNNKTYMTAELTSTGAIIPQTTIISVGRNDYAEGEQNA